MNPWVVLAAVAVTVMAAARLTRLVVQDEYPPVVWLREKWDARTMNSDWNLLLHCHWCFGPWATLLVMIPGWFALHSTGNLPDFTLAHLWWAAGAWLAMSYLASWVVNNDEGFVTIKGDK